MHTFYADNGLITGEDAKHAFRVLRLRTGDQITVLDGSKRYRAVIAAISDKSAQAELIEELPSNEPDIKVTVYQGLPKSEKLELLAQKLTELGIYRLVPVKMERSIAKLDGEKRIERLERISREAVKQCRRSRPLIIDPVTGWNSAIEKMKQHDIMLVPWENAGSLRLKEVYNDNKNARDIGILIGCEGGISENEIQQAPAVPVSLGPRILRCETAAMTAAAIVMSLFGDI